MRRIALALAVVISVLWLGRKAAAEPGVGKLPHVEFNAARRQVRVECEAISVDAPLEFFCCVTGTNEHESLLRTAARPSDIQVGLLAVGLKPGQPLTYSEAMHKWFPPQGPPLHITLEYQKDGKAVSVPGYRWLRNLKTKKPPAAFSWVYTGSRVMSDGKFAADITGYVVSIVNFDLTLIDVPMLASSANETLEWERNTDLTPPTGTKVWMVIEPVGKHDADAPQQKSDAAPARGVRIGWASARQWFAGSQSALESSPAGQSAPAAASPAWPGIAAAPATTAPSTAHLSDVHIDQAKVDRLESYWKEKVSPHAKALREAAEAHYKVMSELRREQQRLIDEADHIQRTIDKLEHDYQDMTTPRPEN